MRVEASVNVIVDSIPRKQIIPVRLSSSIGLRVGHGNNTDRYKKSQEAEKTEGSVARHRGFIFFFYLAKTCHDSLL